MTIDADKTKQAVLDELDRDGMVAFLADIVEIPSATGHELDVATFIRDRLLRSGIDARIQQFDDDRANVIATIRGHGGGSTLMLNGHLDTSYSGYEPELQGMGYKNKAVIVDDTWMYGNGVHNMKNALASYVAIMEAMIRADVELAGDVVLAGVAGEIEKAPYGDAQGPEYLGFGTGTSYALAHGLDADMCILGEPTANTIGLSNLGVNWIRLSTKGTMAHTQHAETATNAIYQMQKVIDGLRPWMEDYRRRHAYDGIEPACDITAIEGGWPWRVSRTPVFCDLFLCVRTTPGTRTNTVRRELQEVLRGLKAQDPSLDVGMEFYVSHQPTEISADEPVVQALHANHKHITGNDPEYRRRTAYMDSSALNSHGIPTVVYGPSGRLNLKAGGRGWSPEEGEHILLGDLMVGTEVVAGAVVDLCSSADLA
jgi:acetylornithine deacetylase